MPYQVFNKNLSKSTLWITIFIVRVGSIIINAQPLESLDSLDVKASQYHSYEKLLPDPNRKANKNTVPASSDFMQTHLHRFATSRKSLTISSSEELMDDSCTGKKDGYYANFGSECSSYYFCASGNQVTYLCKPGLKYNGDKCVKDYKCPGSRESNPCFQIPNGYYANSKNPFKYHYCYHESKVIELTCSNGKIYDGLRKKCILKTKEETDELLQLWNSDAICTNKPNGFYPVLRTGCKTYYYCIEQVKTDLECSNGFIFNGDVCVQADDTDFRCPELGKITANNPKSRRRRKRRFIIGY